MIFRIIMNDIEDRCHGGIYILEMEGEGSRTFHEEMSAWGLGFTGWVFI